MSLSPERRRELLDDVLKLQQELSKNLEELRDSIQSSESTSEDTSSTLRFDGDEVAYYDQLAARVLDLRAAGISTDDIVEALGHDGVGPRTLVECLLHVISYGNVIVEVSGGVVSSVYGGWYVGVRVCDWDNIKSGDVFDWSPDDSDWHEPDGSIQDFVDGSYQEVLEYNERNAESSEQS